MGGSSSKAAGDSTSSAALSGAPPVRSGPCSLPSPRDCLNGAAARTCIPPGEAEGQPSKRRGCSPVGRDGKRIKGVGNGDVSGGIMVSDVGQLQRSDEVRSILVTTQEQESQSLLFSCQPTGAASEKTLDLSGSRQNVQHFSSFKLDGAKHKIFLSHSGAQKDFVEQLYVDLEAQGYLFPFFDLRHHSLPKGKDFMPLIKEAAQLCHVAVIVLSEEFLSSKWPMIELAEFYGSQQGGNQHLNLLPLFYKVSIKDLGDQSIEDRWMPIWEQHANGDERIDVTKWSAAVKALRGVNGLTFCKNAMRKVDYRRHAVQCILRLSPPDLLNDSCRDVVGYDRMCQAVSGQFVEDTRIGAQVLGLYGMSGVGKSTLSKALCDYFYERFSGRVCHVELGEFTELSRIKRQTLMLKMLCGFEKDVLGRIGDGCQGLKQMRDHMMREPVFLAIDNVSNDERSWKEAVGYLMVGFHPESRIMITSRSKVILQDLLPELKFCMAMPRLSAMEAGAIFLRSAAPMKSTSLLTDEERAILGLCIQQCLFHSIEDGAYLDWKSYHPLALSALGDCFYRLSNSRMLVWKDHLEKNEDLLKEVWKSPSIMSMIGLQFSTLHPSEQLLFLDIALFKERIFGGVEWLCEMHEEKVAVVERKLRDLKRSGMITWNGGDYFSVHDLYREFAVWYVTEHDVKGMKNAWGVFRTSGSSLRCDTPASKCWSDLVRLRIFDLTRANARVFASKTMQELHNLVVLQLRRCTHLTVLNLEGLDCLRDLELVGLSKLVSVTLTGNSDTREDAGIIDSLRYVRFAGLKSLTHVPDFRSCTSLQLVRISGCSSVTDWEGIECPHLKALELLGLVRGQFGRIPNFKSLQSLRGLFIVASSPDMEGDCYGVWRDVRDEDSECSVRHIEGLEDAEAGHRLVEEVRLYMRQWHRFRLHYCD